MRTPIVGAVAVALVIAGPFPAWAETFVIGPHSYLVFDYEGDFFRFVGDDFAINDNSYGTFIPRTMDGLCSPCQAGDIVDPGFRTPRGEVLLGTGTGSAMVDGVVYTNLTYRGWLDVDAVPLAFPESQEFTVYAQTLFTLTGFLRAFSGDTEVFSGDLFGEGRATAPYFQSEEGYIWEEGRLDYRFRDTTPAPVPEPATMLLFGLGLAGLKAARSRRRPQVTGGCETTPAG